MECKRDGRYKTWIHMPDMRRENAREEEVRFCRDADETEQLNVYAAGIEGRWLNWRQGRAKARSPAQRRNERLGP